MTQYNRNLPHWFPDGKSIFLTWRLYGSLPPKWTPKKIPGISLTDGQKFRQADSLLDRATSGPLWLKDSRISSNIVATLKKGAEELKQYQLHAFVVMANHVHILLLPQIPVARITKGIKGVTAKEANQLLGRTGQCFWQDESYDAYHRSATVVMGSEDALPRVPIRESMALFLEGS